MPDYPFVRAKFYTPVERRDINGLMVHAMQAPEKPTAAEGCARYFAAGCPDAQGRLRKASAHYCGDSDSIVQCVRDMDVAYGCGGANHDFLHFEFAGYSEQSGAQWDDPYSQAMLALMARLFAQKARQYRVPIRWLSINDLKAGNRRGITSHNNAAKAFRKSDHWDPGPNFPTSQFIKLVEVAYQAADQDRVTLMAGDQDVTALFGAKMVNGHVMIGVKQVCEHLDCEYRWDPKTRTLHTGPELIGEEA